MEKQSLLAQMLERLIVESGQSRKAVAKKLGVSPQIVSRWLHDQTLPKPQHVKGIVDIACRNGAKLAVKAFNKMVELPARQVTPFYKSNKSKKIGKNISSYLTGYRVEELLKKILAKTCTKTLSRNEKLCRKLAEFVHTTF